MKKKTLLLVVLIVFTIGLTGCLEQSAARQQAEKTETLMQEAERQIGMPNIQNFYERRMAKDVFELRDQADLITYIYYKSEMDGQLVYLGRGVGFGLPYSTQYTNPEKYRQNGATLPQPDPNGLFMPAGENATWIMYINEDTGEREIIFAESDLTITQSKLPSRLVKDWSLPDDY